MYDKMWAQNIYSKVHFPVPTGIEMGNHANPICFCPILNALVHKLLLKVKINELVEQKLWNSTNSNAVLPTIEKTLRSEPICSTLIKRWLAKRDCCGVHTPRGWFNNGISSAAARLFCVSLLQNWAMRQIGSICCVGARGRFRVRRWKKTISRKFNQPPAAATTTEHQSECIFHAAASPGVTRVLIYTGRPFFTFSERFYRRTRQRFAHLFGGPQAFLFVCLSWRA